MNSKFANLFQEGGADTREEAKQDVGPTHFQNVEFKLVQSNRVFKYFQNCPIIENSLLKT